MRAWRLRRSEPAGGPACLYLVLAERCRRRRRRPAERPAAATDRRPAGRACLDPPPHHGFHLTTWQLGKGEKKRKIRDCGRRAIFRVLFHRSSSSSLGLLLFGSPVRLLFLRCCCVTQESRTRISCVLAPSCMLGVCGTCVRPNSRGTWGPADVGWYKQSECGLISNLKPALDWTCRVWLPPVKFLKSHFSTFEVLNID